MQQSGLEIRDSSSSTLRPNLPSGRQQPSLLQSFQMAPGLGLNPLTSGALLSQHKAGANLGFPQGVPPPFPVQLLNPKLPLPTPPPQLIASVKQGLISAAQAGFLLAQQAAAALQQNSGALLQPTAAIQVFQKKFPSMCPDK